MGEANCIGLDPRVFFPDPRDDEGEARAKAVCRACPVQAACLVHAITTHEAEGVWGGTSGQDRRRMVKRTRRGQSVFVAL